MSSFCFEKVSKGFFVFIYFIGCFVCSHVLASDKDDVQAHSNAAERALALRQAEVLRHIVGGFSPVYVGTVSLKDSSGDTQEVDVSSDGKLLLSRTMGFLENLIGDIAREPSGQNAFSMIVTQEGLFNPRKRHLQDRRVSPLDRAERSTMLDGLKGLSRRNPKVFLIVNYLYEKEMPTQQGLSIIRDFLKNIWPAISSESDPLNSYAFGVFTSTERFLKQQKREQKETSTVLRNKTEMYWEGQKVFSYRKMSLGGSDLEGLSNPIYLPGTKLHYDKNPVSKSLSEIFGFEICQDHFLKTFCKLGGGTFYKQIFSYDRRTRRHVPRKNLEKNKSIRAIDQTILNEAPLFHVIQSDTIAFNEHNVPFQNGRFIIIHADSDFRKSNLYFWNSGESIDVGHRFVDGVHYTSKVFEVSATLKEIQFFPKYLNQDMGTTIQGFRPLTSATSTMTSISTSSHAPASPQISREGQNLPLLGTAIPINEETQEDSNRRKGCCEKCCEECIIL